MKPPLHDLFNAIGPIAYPTLCEDFAPNCCIAACRILTRVLAHFGYRAETQPCYLYVYNGPMTKLIENGVTIPAEYAAKLRLFDLTGAWGIGIVSESAFVGKPVPGGRFGGHTVLTDVRRYAEPGQPARAPHRVAAVPGKQLGAGRRRRCMS